MNFPEFRSGVSGIVKVGGPIGRSSPQVCSAGRFVAVTAAEVVGFFIEQAANKNADDNSKPIISPRLFFTFVF